jgi:hypothetical protein
MTDVVAARDDDRVRFFPSAENRRPNCHWNELPYRYNCDTADYTSLGLTKPLAGAGSAILVRISSSARGQNKALAPMSVGRGPVTQERVRNGTLRGLIQEKPQQDDDGNGNPEHPQKYSA